MSKPIIHTVRSFRPRRRRLDLQRKKLRRLCAARWRAGFSFQVFQPVPNGESAVPAISFKTHLALDVANGLFAAAPQLFGFSESKKARNFFLTASAFGIAAGLFSEPQDMTEREQVKEFGEE